MRKNIWIMNHYAGSMFFDKGGRHYNFAKYLRRAGYEPVIFCTNSKHGQQELFFDNKDLWHEHIAEEIATPFVFVKARTYQGNGKQRVLNMIDFYRNVKKSAKQYAKEHGTPDIIYASSVHPLTLIAGIQLAKYFGIKCICEVRDLWPESIVAYSKRFTKNYPLIKILYQGEKWIYKKADSLIFTMEGAYDYIVDQGWEQEISRSKVYYINNGVDLEVFHYNREHFEVEDDELLNPNLFTVVYTGTLVTSNNIDGMLDFAKRLQKYPDVRLLIWGNGECTESMLLRIRNEHIDNICYKGVVDKKYIPYIVSRANINLMHAAPTSLYRYGASPNKLFDYLAAGRQILQDFTYNQDIVQRYRCGISCDWNLEKMMEAFETLYHANSEEKCAMCRGAEQGAADYDFENLTKKLIFVIERIPQK